MSKNIASIRTDYTLKTLDETEVTESPIDFFSKWFAEALDAEVDDVNAMTLCTVSADMQAHGRIVLLKGISNNQFLFYTNYNSHKGEELKQNPKASLVFYWKELQRQVRIEGIVSKVSEADSDEYFLSRPIESQIGAWASDQSHTIANRQELETKFEQFKEKFKTEPLSRPPHWGGYALNPSRIEFWQGRASRLHDRILYTYNNEVWLIQRLNP